MKVIVNGTLLLAPLTGIGQYIRHLFTAMERLPQADVLMYYGGRCERGVRLPNATTTKAVQRAHGLLSRLVPRPRTMRRLVERSLFRYHTRGGLNDVIYHEPSSIAMPYRGPLVLTICDLSCFDHPETHPAERVRLMQRDMPAAIERADQIIVISEATRLALQRWFNVDSQRISTTYLAADPRFRPHKKQELSSGLHTLGLACGAYVLCVGTLEPRKNLSVLFSAYAELPATLRRRFPLVVAGMSGWSTEGLMRSAAKLIERNELRLLGYVQDELIPVLYAGAAAFCYPSRYEGFGLPALEAMASGIPVVTANQTSLPEVVGQAGIMVEPDDVDGMREALHRLLEDRAFARDLAALGLERSQLFSWDKCARETVGVYEKVMQKRGLDL